MNLPGLPDEFTNSMRAAFQGMQDHLDAFRKDSGAPEASDAASEMNFAKAFAEDIDRFEAAGEGIFSNKIPPETKAAVTDFFRKFLDEADECAGAFTEPGAIKDSVENARLALLSDSLNINDMTGDKNAPEPEEGPDDAPDKTRFEQTMEAVGRLDEKEKAIKTEAPALPEYEINEMIPAEPEEIDSMLAPGAFDMVLDKNGKSYKDPEEIRSMLEKDDASLYIYPAGEEYPYVMRRTYDGEYETSKESLSPYAPLTENFVPKASLKQDDIARMVEITETTSRWDNSVKQTVHEDRPVSYEKLSKLSEDAGGKLSGVKNSVTNKAFKETFTKIQKEKILAEVNRRRAAKFLAPLTEPGNEPEAPDETHLSGGQWFLRSVVKILTLGIADTKAGRARRRALKELNAKQKAYRKNKAEYDQWVKPELDKFLKAIDDAASEEHQKALADDDARLRDERHLESRRVGLSYNRMVEELRDYRSNIEVRLEGMRDIKEHGLTPDNLFAHIWRLNGDLAGQRYDPSEVQAKQDRYAELARQIIEGKEQHKDVRDLEKELKPITAYLDRISDLERKMAQYIMATEVQQKMYNVYGNNINLNQASHESMVKALQNNSQISRLMESKAFKETLKEVAKEPSIQPEMLCEKFLVNCSQRFNRGEALKTSRQNLIDTFGKRIPDAKHMSEVFRLNLLDHYIKVFNESGKPGVLGKKYARMMQHGEAEEIILSDIMGRSFKEGIEPKLVDKNDFDRYKDHELQQDFAEWAAEMQEAHKEWVAKMREANKKDTKPKKEGPLKPDKMRKANKKDTKPKKEGLLTLDEMQEQFFSWEKERALERKSEKADRENARKAPRVPGV